MGGRQTLRDLATEAHDVDRIELATALDVLTERTAGDILHHEERNVALFLDFMLLDTRMAHMRQP